MGPVLGALADYKAWKKRLLAVCVVIGVAATFLFMTIERGAWMYAAALFMIANIGVAGSLVFYDSLLPHIASPEEIDRVSTAGYAIGFIGGGLLLLLNLAWIQSPTTFGLPDQIAAIKLTFASALRSIVIVGRTVRIFATMKSVPPRFVAWNGDCVGKSVDWVRPAR